MPRVLILYNEPVLPAGHPDAESEREVLGTAGFVERTLTQAGFEVGRLGASHDPAFLLTKLAQHRPEVVFNLFEGTADDGLTEAYVAGLLEWLRVPFTGCPSQTLFLARSKHWTKYLLRGAAIPTPDFFVVEAMPPPPCPLRWPVIIKPASEDASVGLDQGSVVTEQKLLEDRVALLLERYGPPVLVEEFIAGRELNVALVETPQLRPLPISEILFLEKDPAYWPIVTYDAKWKPESRDYQATPPHCPAELPAGLVTHVEELSERAFRLLSCRDYARVDVRLDSAGEPYVLEVNPNPDFHPTAGFGGALAAAGSSHEQFTAELVRNALARRPQAVY